MTEPSKPVRVGPPGADPSAAQMQRHLRGVNVIAEQGDIDIDTEAEIAARHVAFSKRDAPR